MMKEIVLKICNYLKQNCSTFISDRLGASSEKKWRPIYTKHNICLLLINVPFISIYSSQLRTLMQTSTEFIAGIHQIQRNEHFTRSEAHSRQDNKDSCFVVHDVCNWTATSGVMPSDPSLNSSANPSSRAAPDVAPDGAPAAYPAHHLTQHLAQHLTQHLTQHLAQYPWQHLTQHLTQHLPQHLTVEPLVHALVTADHRCHLSSWNCCSWSVEDMGGNLRNLQRKTRIRSVRHLLHAKINIKYVLQTRL